MEQMERALLQVAALRTLNVLLADGHVIESLLLARDVTANADKEQVISDLQPEQHLQSCVQRVMKQLVRHAAMTSAITRTVSTCDLVRVQQVLYRVAVESEVMRRTGVAAKQGKEMLTGVHTYTYMYMYVTRYTVVLCLHPETLVKLKRAHAVTNPDKSHKSIITKATKSFCMTSPLLPTTDRQSDATRTQIDSGSFDQLHQLLLRPPILDSDSSDNIAPPPLRISNVSHAPVVTQRHPMLGLTSVTNIESATCHCIA